MKLADCRACGATDAACEAVIAKHPDDESACCCAECYHQPISRAVNITSRREFIIRCADGVIADAMGPLPTVEDADRESRMWDADCDCGGPHRVYVRTVDTTDWEPLDEPVDSSRTEATQSRHSECLPLDTSDE